MFDQSSAVFELDCWTDGQTLSPQGSICSDESVRSCRAADHNTTTPVFDYKDPPMKYFLVGIWTIKNFHTCLCRPQEVCPEILGITQMVLPHARCYFFYFLVSRRFHVCWFDSFLSWPIDPFHIIHLSMIIVIYLIICTFLCTEQQKKFLEKGLLTSFRRFMGHLLDFCSSVLFDGCMIMRFF